ncbi:MAG: hypothetical protein HYX56_06910 [Chloroflexi bacterium]|nr:hypothetical protein [Chloroflexota bacterium]
MTREQSALLRLVILCMAWALGEAIEWQMGALGLGPLFPAVLAAAAYVATRDLMWSGPAGGGYWRGRNVDRDRWRR